MKINLLHTYIPIELMWGLIFLQTNSPLPIFQHFTALFTWMFLSVNLSANHNLRQDTVKLYDHSKARINQNLTFIHWFALNIKDEIGSCLFTNTCLEIMHGMPLNTCGNH